MGKRDTVFSGPNLFLNPLKVHEQILRNQSSAHKRAATKPRNRQPAGKGIGHFFGAMQIDGFIDKDEVTKQIDDWIQDFRKTKPAPGTNGPLIPGDLEREAEAVWSKQGIPLLKPGVDDLTGVPFETEP